MGFNSGFKGLIYLTAREDNIKMIFTQRLINLVVIKIKKLKIIVKFRILTGINKSKF